MVKNDTLRNFSTYTQFFTHQTRNGENGQNEWMELKSYVCGKFHNHIPNHKMNEWNIRVRYAVNFTTTINHKVENFLFLERNSRHESKNQNGNNTQYHRMKIKAEREVILGVWSVTHPGKWPPLCALVGWVNGHRTWWKTRKTETTKKERTNTEETRLLVRDERLPKLFSGNIRDQPPEVIPSFPRLHKVQNYHQACVTNRDN